MYTSLTYIKFFAQELRLCSVVIWVTCSCVNSNLELLQSITNMGGNYHTIEHSLFTKVKFYKSWRCRT